MRNSGSVKKYHTKTGVFEPPLLSYSSGSHWIHVPPFRTRFRSKPTPHRCRRKPVTDDTDGGRALLAGAVQIAASSGGTT